MIHEIRKRPENIGRIKFTCKHCFKVMTFKDTNVYDIFDYPRDATAAKNFIQTEKFVGLDKAKILMKLGQNFMYNEAMRIHNK